ncbi:hypothetical protein SLA2020_413130 [Shorea laevis]
MVKRSSSGVVIRDIDEGNNVRDIVSRDYNEESDDGADDEEEDDGSSGYHDNDDGDIDRSIEPKFAIDQVVSSNAAFPYYTTPTLIGRKKEKSLKIASTKIAIYMTSFNQQQEFTIHDEIVEDIDGSENFYPNSDALSSSIDFDMEASFYLRFTEI